MSDISNTDDTIDVRDVIDRVEELREERDSHNLDDDGNNTANDWVSDYPDEAAELAKFESLLSDLAGYGGDHQWKGDWYPTSIIHDSYFTEAMQELCEEIGDIPKGFPSYIVIDWEATADNLRVDYSSIKFDGETYWYRWVMADKFNSGKATTGLQSTAPPPPYQVKRDGALWIVLSTSTGLQQFHSLRRVNCTDWVRANSPSNP
jgi:hypothetical protein